jgi:hypothetical protein
MLGLGVENVRQSPLPALEWARVVQRMTYLIIIRKTSTKQRRSYHSFQYCSSKAVTTATLESLRPGISAALTRQIENRPIGFQAIPIALLAFDAGGRALNLSTYTFSFEIAATPPYPPGTRIEDAEGKLRRCIAERMIVRDD